MTPENVSEAIKETRSIVAVLLTTALLAIVTTDAVRNALLKREHAKHLAAWLLLRDTFTDKADELDNAPKEGRIEEFTEEVADRSGLRPESRPFVLQIPWPAETIRKISIERIAPDSPAFRVHAPDRLLPFQDYAVASIQKKSWILPLQYTQSHSLRAISDAVLMYKLAGPWGWAATRAHLYAAGWDGQAPEDLQLNNPDVAEFIRDGLTASYSIAGIPISTGYYAAAVSLFLGFQAFLLLGPWLKLKDRQTELPYSSWIMLTSALGAGRHWLQATQIVVSAVAVLLPLLALLMQCFLVPYMSIGERFAWAPTTLGPVAAAIFLAAIAIRLTNPRPRMSPPSDKPSAA